MSFPRYSEYKDSRVGWLGEIPDSWQIAPLKRLAALVTGITPPTEKEELFTADTDCLAWFTPDDLDQSGRPSIASKFLSVEGSAYVRVLDAPLTLVCCIGSVGKIGYVTNTCSTNQQITVAAFSKAQRYGYYCLIAARLELESNATGNVLKILNKERLGALLFPCPSTDEALRISVFLDQETAKIDALIEEQRRLIELSKEKRQAVISKAVTKGLDPNVPMADSGSEWLGSIPVHWDAGRLARISERVVVGIAEAATHAYADDGVPILRSTNIRPNQITGAVLKIDTAFAAARDSKVLRVNDLVTVRTGNAGVTAVIPLALDGCQCFTMLITTLEHSHNSRFYSYYLNSAIGQSYFSVEGWGTAQTNISVPILKALPIPIPSSSEQRSIVEYLDTVTAEIDSLSAAAGRLVKLLEERRSALISAAVTGKIDVRNYSSEISAATEEVHELA